MSWPSSRPIPKPLRDWLLRIFEREETSHFMYSLAKSYAMTQIRRVRDGDTHAFAHTNQGKIDPFDVLREAYRLTDERGYCWRITHESSRMQDGKGNAAKHQLIVTPNGTDRQRCQAEELSRASPLVLALAGKFEVSDATIINRLHAAIFACEYAGGTIGLGLRLNHIPADD